MYEVVIPIPLGDSFWRRGGSSDLLEYQSGTTASGHWFKAIHPRAHLVEWMKEYTPSWVYYHEVAPPITTGYFSSQIPTGVLFAFEEASDAVLFKLTWCQL
jgi:hypothetical protein